MPAWAAFLVLAALGSGAFAVFTLLPGWVETQRRTPPPPERHDADEPTMPEPKVPQPEAPGTDPLPPEADDPGAMAAAPEAPRPEMPTRSAPPPVPATKSEKPTREPVDRNEAAFREAMSDGLAALDHGDWATAREALERARSLRPEAPQIADALARVETGEKIATLAVHREQGREHEAAERWRQAEASYRAALALDSTVAFARKGLARAIARAEMAETLQYHLNHPERLSSLAVLEEASALVGRARDMEPAGPEHRRRVVELSERVAEWSKPVTARLVSDGRTRVTLYRVGRLGTFTRRDLELRPGTYTAMGQRPGYRDVRRELVIRPGLPPEPLRVVCDEEI